MLTSMSTSPRSSSSSRYHEVNKKEVSRTMSAVSSGSRFSKKGAMYSAALTQASFKSEDDSSWYVDSASSSS